MTDTRRILLDELTRCMQLSEQEDRTVDVDVDEVDAAIAELVACWDGDVDYVELRDGTIDIWADDGSWRLNLKSDL